MQHWDMPKIAVHFILLPDSLLLDWSGPAEALRIANKLCKARGLQEPFALHFHSPEPQVGSSVGALLTGLAPLPALNPALQAWVVLPGLIGTRVDVRARSTQQVVRWLSQLQLGQGIELVTICAGSVLAAHAGLLAHRRATSHHHHLEELCEVAPTCKVMANRVFVDDPPVYSSAGVTAGIDLILHRIQAVGGASLAAQVAQTMVVALRRGSQDPELSPFLRYRDHLHAGLHRVQDAVAENPREPWTVPSMAALANTSARHLARLFQEHAGIGPHEYVHRLRLELARTALASGKTVSQAAEYGGFTSDAQLRRAWKAHGLPGSPSTQSSRSAPV
jgi:transcriptional regulator GlxA family with amidase domain